MPKVGISGWIDSWEVINKDGSIAQSCHVPKKNMILNGGLDMIPIDTEWYNGSDWTVNLWHYFALGTGTALPTYTDTTLGSESYRGECIYTPYFTQAKSSDGSNPYYVTFSRGVQTPEGALNGTYTEIGFSPSAATNGALFSKFRLVDSEGNPTSVAVATDQQLRLKYIIRVELLPNTPTAYNTTITGIGSFDYTACWQKVTAVYGWHFSDILNFFGATTPVILARVELCEDAYSFVPIGSNSTAPAGNFKAVVPTYDTYVNGSHERFMNAAFAVDDAVWISKSLNVRVEGETYWYVAFDAANYINKPNTHRLTFKFKFSWARG